MRAVCQLILLLVLIPNGAWGWQSTGETTVSGRLDTGADRSDGLVVLNWTRLGTPVAGVQQFGTAAVDSRGDFRIDKLAPGIYSVCARAINQEFLDPCEWDQPIRVDIGEGTRDLRGVRVALKRGVRLQVRFDDPGSLLAGRPNTGAKGLVMAHLWLHNGRHVPLDIKYQTKTELVLETVVPEDTFMRLQVQRQGVRLIQDESVEAANRLVYPDHPAGSVIRSGKIGKPHVFRFTVQPAQ